MTNEERVKFVREILDFVYYDGITDSGGLDEQTNKIVDRWEEDCLPYKAEMFRKAKEGKK